MEKFINSNTYIYTITEKITISKEKYNKLKKKAEIADDVIIQLESSLNDAEFRKVKRVA